MIAAIVKILEEVNERFTSLEREVSELTTEVYGLKHRLKDHVSTSHNKDKEE